MSPRRNWDSPTPLAASECALPPGPKGGGAHSPAAKGVGESQFQRLDIGETLSTLPTLWVADKKKRERKTNAGEYKQLRKIRLRGKSYQMRIQLFNIVESTSTVSLIL
jgi:hypothetical protein